MKQLSLLERITHSPKEGRDTPTKKRGKKKKKKVKKGGMCLGKNPSTGKKLENRGEMCYLWNCGT